MRQTEALGMRELNLVKKNSEKGNENERTKARECGRIKAKIIHEREENEVRVLHIYIYINIYIKKIYIYIYIHTYVQVHI